MTAGVRVLGSLEAEVGGTQVDLGGPRQRAVLALLPTERTQVISVDRLIDQLWRGEPPPRAIASLQAYVSNLRRLLEPGRPPRAQYAVRAAALADRRYAYGTAVSLRAQAVEASDRVTGSLEERAGRDVDLLGGLLRAQVRAGQIAAARATRQRAVDAAESAGRDDLVAAAFAAWTEPTPWQTRPSGFVDERAVSTLERLLSQGQLAPATRCRLLAELAGENDPRPDRAAGEALAIARDLGDEDLLPLALTASATAADFGREPDRRAALGTELAAIGECRGQPAHQWYGEYIAGTAATARADPAELRRRLDRGQRLADQYRMSEPQAVQLCSDAMLSHIEGRFAQSRLRYAEAAAQMRRNGSLHADGFLGLAMQPAAQSLGELCALPGRPDQAAGYFAQAEKLARRWNSPHWTARARKARAGL